MSHPAEPAVTSDVPPAELTRLDTNPKVELRQDATGRWQLFKGDRIHRINGAGGVDHLEALVAAGGTTLRTWGIEQLESQVSGESLLDKAHRLDLSVMVGIWLKHPRHGADYRDPAFLESQRVRVRAAVRKYRNHPALLLWGLGNEMEESGDDPHIWRELEQLARIVKAEDPRHPVCTVIAGTENHKVAKMLAHYRSLDLLGVNIYGGAEGVDAALAAQGWERPYLITEFGPVGHWEIATTAWGAPIEPSPIAKAATYYAAHTAQFTRGRGLCLGTFCFIWGQKQETTATWFGMFLASGEKTSLVDVMSRLWTGEEPKHPAPAPGDLRADFREAKVAPGSEHEVWLQMPGSDLHALSFDWQVVAETRDRRSGGDAEEAPPIIPGCVQRISGARACIRTPDIPGAYRVFLYVRDSHGGGAAVNFPFYVE
jgi:hypothetical protein